ncbi:MAG: hypothetical protein IPG50_34620 [Myxococcales bacterium]|nr:hypothetical protein [Myxococcales bacterium]
MTLRELGLGAVVLFSGWTLAACSSDGTTGGSADGGAGSGPGDGGGGGQQDGGTSDAGASDGGKKPFGEACASPADCESGQCFIGGSQAFCSLKCTMATQATDCPTPPTTGQCNNQGYCRK